MDYTYILVIIGAGITMLAQALVTGRYNKYKEISSSGKTTGKEIARRILDANGLEKVKVQQVQGELTDHYDPTNKTVNLSTRIYNESSIASVAVAAHECGHAIQDKVGYNFLKIRHNMVPTVNICSKLGYLVIFIGLLAGFFKIAMIGLILLGAILVFQLVTLPVEFNASSRAKKQLKELGLVNQTDSDGVSDMLFSAALTYVAALASSILQILRLFLMITSRKRNN